MVRLDDELLNSRGEEGREGHLVREWVEEAVDVDDTDEETEDRLEIRTACDSSSSKRESTGEATE